MFIAIGGSIILGIGLISLWAAEYIHPPEIVWLMWLTGAIGVFSLFSALLIGLFESLEGLIPLGLAAILLSCWAAGVSLGSPAYQSWWLFWSAFAYLMLGLRALGPPHYEGGSEAESKPET